MATHNTIVALLWQCQQMYIIFVEPFNTSCQQFIGFGHTTAYPYCILVPEDYLQQKYKSNKVRNK